MSNMELVKKLNEYTELKRMAAELADTLEAIENEIKAEMGESEILTVQGYKVTYSKYETTRFDSSTFKKEHAAMYELYTKKSEARRFAVR